MPEAAVALLPDSIVWDGVSEDEITPRSTLRPTKTAVPRFSPAEEDGRLSKIPIESAKSAPFGAAFQMLRNAFPTLTDSQIRHMVWTGKQMQTSSQGNRVVFVDQLGKKKRQAKEKKRREGIKNGVARAKPGRRKGVRKNNGKGRED